MAETSGGGLKIDSREALEAWLKGKPRAVAQAIATRAALRVLPLIGRANRNSPEYLWIKLHYFVFRVIFLSLNSIHRGKNLKLTIAACDDAFENASKYLEFIGGISTYTAAGYAYSAIAAARTAYIKSYSYAAADAVSHASSSAVWQAVQHDCRQIDRGGATLTDILNSPLWFHSGLEGIENAPPHWIRDAWRVIINDQDLAGAGFAPWFRWYEGIAGLDGDPTRDIFGPELSLKIALQPDDWWKRGPEAVNADIARWLAEKEGETPEEEPELAAEIAEIGENPPQQRPAAYRFAWRGGKLAPLPPDPAQDAADAAVMLDELRRKVGEFAERLTGRNYEPRIARSVELLLAALPEDLAAVNPGLLRSRGRSIENDAVFFAASDELPEDVKSHLSDLAGSLRDLLVCYPQIREKELAARALDLIGADVDQVLRDLTATRDGAAAAPDVVAVETVQAFDAMAQAPEDPATFVHSDAGRLWLADRLLVAGNYLAELARGVTTVVYDRLAQVGTKAGDAWREVRPKIADAAVEELEFTKTPNGFFSVANLLAAAPVMGIVCLLGYPLLKPMIERAIKHLKTLATKPPDDG